MRCLRYLFPLALVAVALPACKKESVEEQGTSTAAYIAFRTDSGLVYRNDTVGVSDTLHVIAHVTEGDDRLRAFMLEVSYDGAAAHRVDSIGVTGNPLDYDTHLIMRDAAGTEKWTFIAVEEDWDRTTRSLTFVVH